MQRSRDPNKKVDSTTEIEDLLQLRGGKAEDSSDEIDLSADSEYNLGSDKKAENEGEEGLQASDSSSEVTAVLETPDATVKVTAIKKEDHPTAKQILNAIDDKSTKNILRLNVGADDKKLAKQVEDAIYDVGYFESVEKPNAAGLRLLRENKDILVDIDAAILNIDKSIKIIRNTDYDAVYYYLDKQNQEREVLIKDHRKKTQELNPVHPYLPQMEALEYYKGMMLVAKHMNVNSVEEANKRNTFLDRINREYDAYRRNVNNYQSLTPDERTHHLADQFAKVLSEELSVKKNKAAWQVTFARDWGVLLTTPPGVCTISNMKNIDCELIAMPPQEEGENSEENEANFEKYAPTITSNTAYIREGKKLFYINKYEKKFFEVNFDAYAKLVKSNAAYIRSEDKLFYINKKLNMFVEVVGKAQLAQADQAKIAQADQAKLAQADQAKLAQADQAKLAQFDETLQSANARNLSDDEINAISRITQHTHIETTHLTTTTTAQLATHIKVGQVKDEFGNNYYDNEFDKRYDLVLLPRQKDGYVLKLEHLPKEITHAVYIRYGDKLYFADKSKKILEEVRLLPKIDYSWDSNSKDPEAAKKAAFEEAKFEFYKKTFESDPNFQYKQLYTVSTDEEINKQVHEETIKQIYKSHPGITLDKVKVELEKKRNEIEKQVKEKKNWIENNVADKKKELENKNKKEFCIKARAELLRRKLAEFDTAMGITDVLKKNQIVSDKALISEPRNVASEFLTPRYKTLSAEKLAYIKATTGHQPTNGGIPDWVKDANEFSGFKKQATTTWIDNALYGENNEMKQIRECGVSAPPSGRCLPTPANLLTRETYIVEKNDKDNKIINEKDFNFVSLGTVSAYEIKSEEEQARLAKQQLKEIIRARLRKSIEEYRDKYAGFLPSKEYIERYQRKYDRLPPQCDFFISYQTLLSPFKLETKIYNISRDNNAKFIEMTKQAMKEVEQELDLRKELNTADFKIDDLNIKFVHTNSAVNKWASTWYTKLFRRSFAEDEVDRESKFNSTAALLDSVLGSLDGKLEGKLYDDIKGYKNLEINVDKLRAIQEVINGNRKPNAELSLVLEEYAHLLETNQIYLLGKEVNRTEKWEYGKVLIEPANQKNESERNKTLCIELATRIRAAYHLRECLDKKPPYDKLPNYQRNLTAAGLEYEMLGSQGLKMVGCKSARDRTGIFEAIVKTMAQELEAMMKWAILKAGVVKSLNEGQPFRVMTYHCPVVKVGDVHNYFMKELTTKIQNSIRKGLIFTKKLSSFKWPSHLKPAFSLFSKKKPQQSLLQPVDVVAEEKQPPQNNKL